MKRISCLFTLTLLLLSPIAQAELKVANVFSDHMVLQQEMPIRVWGWAEPGSTVVVELTNDDPTARFLAAQAFADKKGYWQAKLGRYKADGKVYTLEVESGEEKIEFKDILIGEVWICSGQSNMEWPVKACANPQEEIANADYPMIRLFNVPKHIAQVEPQKDAQQAVWQVCSPETVAGFSACGYYFGRALNNELNVPIGLVGTNWGGTRIEPWTPPVGFEKVPELKSISEQLKSGELPGDPNAKNLRTKPTTLYNGMVAGLTPMSARGVIWYQGESNARDGLKYNYLKEGLVKGWRDVFQNEDLSFYWVGLAGFGRGHAGTPEGGGWGPVREGQRRALRLPNTGMAVTTDIGDPIGGPFDIHPKNKQDIGARLALWALAKDYGKDVVYSGPMYKSHDVKGDTVVVHFDHVGGGLMAATKGGEHLMGPVTPTPDATLEAFALQAEDGRWHWATATIDGDTVVLKSDKVKNPKAVRYAYDTLPKVNFYNKEGLPA
ncbi:MAG: sialate O-acetylesterase, partial [Phycisphaeraceae bacterium]